MLELHPITQKAAFKFVKEHHRHHPPPRGSLFQVAVREQLRTVGVAIIERPKAKALQNGITAEVSRLCTIEGAPKNTASKLYAAAWRAARALGYRRLITYVLDSEAGTSVLGAGWKDVGRCGGGSWNRPSRPRKDKAPTVKKRRYEVIAA